MTPLQYASHRQLSLRLVHIVFLVLIRQPSENVISAVFLTIYANEFCLACVDYFEAHAPPD